MIVLHALRQKSLEEGERAQVINLYTSNIEVEKVKNKVEKKLTNTFLDQYIHKPTIDLVKLKLIIEIISQSNLSQSRKESYIVGTMLIQIALDIHEQVPNSSEAIESTTEKTTRQLTVLAGDYYSSLYYLTLSQLEDIELVRTLAIAVKEINELKMKRYFREVDSFDEFIQLEQKIESTLYIHLADFFNLSSTSLTTIIEQLMIMNKLKNEKIKYYNKQSSSMLTYWQNSQPFTDEQTMIDTFDKIIEDKVTVIQDLLPNVPNHMQNRFQEILNEIIS